MLESLTIRRIALIDEVTIHFHSGMQVLTGETGAGKSIVVDSVNLVLGGRADRDLIRTGYEKASVEAVFTVCENPDVTSFMDREGIEYDGETVTVFREISANGRNICRINGIMTALSSLKELSVFLLDLHGQSEHQFLTDPERQLAFLDQTGYEKHQELLARIRLDYQQFIDNHRAYAKLVRKNENREERVRSLERDLEELRRAGIRPGEAAALTEKRKKLEKAEQESETLRTISAYISGGENEGGLSGIRQGSAALKALAEKDESFRDISDRCESLYYELEEIAYQISLKTRDAESDPEELRKTDERLDLIHRLERKFGTDADSIPEMLQKAEEEYTELVDLEDEIERMSSDHKRLLGIYRNTAKKLTESRKRLSSEFEKRMMNELNELGMGNTRFHVEFMENNTGRPLMPTEAGDDRIEFLISPNPGEPLRPLARIASGGELSRLMLAVKTLESSHTGVEAMVFDEIDTGISGRMAQVVAEKMMMISRERQVICVTHLPQIAAAADFHYLVSKTVSDGRTVTSVSELDRKGRCGEVSRMISGADGINADSDAYASSMLTAADEMKRKAE